MVWLQNRRAKLYWGVSLEQVGTRPGKFTVKEVMQLIVFSFTTPVPFTRDAAHVSATIASTGEWMSQPNFALASATDRMPSCLPLYGITHTKLRSLSIPESEQKEAINIAHTYNFPPVAPLLSMLEQRKF